MSTNIRKFKYELAFLKVFEPMVNYGTPANNPLAKKMKDIIDIIESGGKLDGKSPEYIESIDYMQRITEILKHTRHVLWDHPPLESVSGLTDKKQLDGWIKRAHSIREMALTCGNLDMLERIKERAHSLATEVDKLLQIRP
jgi:hypothetical protein